jgi:hypothetical protein
MFDIDSEPVDQSDPAALEAFELSNPDLVASNEELAARSKARRIAREGGN